MIKIYFFSLCFNLLSIRDRSILNITIKLGTEANIEWQNFVSNLNANFMKKIFPELMRVGTFVKNIQGLQIVMFGK